MPRTNLDIIAKKYITREKLRTTNDRNNFRYPADDPEARNFNPAENRWNLSANDMAALDGYLANNIELFQDKSVLPKKVKLEDANDGLDRIKRKDYSKYSKLPDALKEYYGRKKYIELFGNDQDLPPLSELNEDQKARLDEFARDPAFRMIIATLMDRCPNDENGIAQKERLKEYDSYMSQKLLEGMLSPVTEENKQRIRTKYPNAHKGDNILEIYEEKQVFTAKTLFMTQLGRIDIRTGGNHPTVKPYDGQISELFSHGSRTRSARALVAGHVDALDVAETLQRLQNHDHHDGGAVGVGDDAARTVQGVLSVALGHHQGHVVVHAEGRAVVNHHTAVFCDVGGKFLAGAGTGTGEGDVDVLEVIVVLQQLHLQFLATEGVCSAGTALRAEQHQFIHREISLVEQAQKLLAHGARSAHNSYFHFVFLCRVTFRLQK